MAQGGSTDCTLVLSMLAFLKVSVQPFRKLSNEFIEMDRWEFFCIMLSYDTGNASSRFLEEDYSEFIFI